MKQSSDNPFRTILTSLGTATKTVTIDYLNELALVFKTHGVNFETYGSIFEMLQFLEEHKCVKLTKNDREEWELTGLYNYG